MKYEIEFDNDGRLIIRNQELLEKMNEIIEREKELVVRFHQDPLNVCQQRPLPDTLCGYYLDVMIEGDRVAIFGCPDGPEPRGPIPQPVRSCFDIKFMKKPVESA